MLHDGRLFGRTARSFTLQWHLTHACAHACRHCCDRSTGPELPLSQTRLVLAQLGRFCLRRGVTGGVCFTGGDPLLYPGFFDLYRDAARAGFELSILGNPAGDAELAALCAVERPRYYQVSLEGTAACNDSIRGDGHFARTMAFLERLRAHGIRSHVMLTLHGENLGEAEGLAAALQGRADRFLFNRLAQVGGGASLRQLTRRQFAAFLRRWLVLARDRPFLGFKDNLLNIPLHHFGRTLRGGCTGVGCGAAFNFVAVMPDGEAHACRKLPSPLGNVLASGLEAVYESDAARRCRVGCVECYLCPIRNRCGGCLAVGHGLGRDVFEQADPHCFFADRHELIRELAREGREADRAPGEPP
jgi:selenobiotic family peptide radical SAM maturase